MNRSQFTLADARRMQADLAQAVDQLNRQLAGLASRHVKLDIETSEARVPLMDGGYLILPTITVELLVYPDQIISDPLEPRKD